MPMKTRDIQLKAIIANAAKIIAPLWPLKTMIARNPLQGLENEKFEDAFAIGDILFTRGATNNDVNREMIKWCQAFLDEGQATIKMPEREKGFYRAWSLLAPYDHVLRTSKKNEWLFSLPLVAEEAIFFGLDRLAIPEDQIEDYLKRILAELPGWAGYIKWRAEWQNQYVGFQNPITLTDFLAVRLLITCALGEVYKKKESEKHPSLSKKAEFFTKLKNKEERFLQTLVKMIVPVAKVPTPRPDAQIVFCIDVRSEPLRLRLERLGNYETFGCAGFFGVPVSIHSYGTDKVKDCCPVLLKPEYQVFEEPIERGDSRRRSILAMCRGFYQDLKYNFATPFALVETLGLWCGFAMIIRTLMPLCSIKFKQVIQEKLGSSLLFDIPLAKQINFAESALRMMGMTKHFSRLVVLCGHGSQTENNPYASALDCGACGGNHGGPNGRILATILNSGEVRAALLQKGIDVPDDTLFLGAEHTTTTDEVVIYSDGIVGPSHDDLVEKLKADLVRAGIATSHYRCSLFGLKASPADSKNHVMKRSSDWAEVRPEWGLARNAAFIIGPRSLTKDLDLDGRCFLHSYQWEEDEAGMSLETIMTAPMVVAEWINTQYFFSTLNNIAYGSGSKITHNVTGKMGVMQGNGSDLMQGLPLQSVNLTDDISYHEAMRLQVLIYAPRSRIDSIIAKHAILQSLLFNHWVILAAIDPQDNKPYRLTGRGGWVEMDVVTESHLPVNDEKAEATMFR